MAATVQGIHLGPDTHANRPAADAAGLPVGALYVCSDHAIIYQTDGATWSNWWVGAGVIPAEIGIACSDESTAITAGTAKATFRVPYAMTLTGVRASLVGACATGTFTVDINEAGVSILSTKLTIDATEKTSASAAVAAVISDSALADDAEITVDVDDAGDGTAKGLKVWLIGTRT